MGMPHGLLAAVHLPDSPDDVPAAVLDRLPPIEAAHAVSLRGYRQAQFVGGRLALRIAATQLGWQLPPALSTERGAPILPKGLVGSISHKRTLAVALLAQDHGWTLGVDLEDYSPARPSIESHVLRPEEIESLTGMPDDRRWIALVQRFSLKEAVYKALDPLVHRYVGFHEASVAIELDGEAFVTLSLTEREGPFDVEARTAWIHGRIVSSVRIRAALVVPNEDRR